MRELEDGQPLERQVSTTGGSIRSWTSRISFETVLSNSRIYRRVRRSGSSQPESAGWSVLSGLSLSDISNLSVFHLGICPAELSNPECYRARYRSLSNTSIGQREGSVDAINLILEAGRSARKRCTVLVEYVTPRNAPQEREGTNDTANDEGTIGF